MLFISHHACCGKMTLKTYVRFSMGFWLGLELGVPPAGQYWATIYSLVHLVDLSLDLSTPVP